VFAWSIKDKLVSKSVEVILGDFEKRLGKLNKIIQRIDNLEGRIKILESEFDEFKDMDEMWAQQMEIYGGTLQSLLLDHSPLHCP
jgi:two-component SAPR family response regulator